MRKNAFTLIELLAVIVILAIILSIAVPSISNVIDTSTKEAFGIDAKMILRAIDNKKLENSDFDVETINNDNIGNLLNITNTNYSSVNIMMEDKNIIITLVGTNKWNGLVACGTYNNIRVVESMNDCSNDVISPVITLLGSNSININMGEVYIDAGATATDNRDGDITNKIVVSGTVNPSIPGIYTITYTVTDMANNKAVLTRTVNVIDNVAPVIAFNPNGNTTYAKGRTTNINVTDIGGIDNNSLKYVWTTSDTEPSIDLFTSSYTDDQNISTPTDVSGSYYLWARASDLSENTIIIKSNAFNLDNEAPVIVINGNTDVTINKGSVYADAGATATDNIDTTVSVITTGTVNPSIVGTYTLIYNATDSSGNAATSVIRTITVVDVSAPVITLNGSNPTNINVGSTYSDAGATAIDDVDGDVTSKIITTGTVNPSIVGTYTITYTVKDNAGNIATATRTVNVIDNVAPTVVFGTNGNSIYAKTRSTTVTVSDNVALNVASLKYLWNTSTTTPTEASFTTSFTNGSTISTPAGVSGSYYLWILAKDMSGNTEIQGSNVFNLDNTNPTVTFGTNGNSVYAKTRSTTVTVSDNVALNVASLKYLWNTSTTTPTEASFTTSFTSGGTISTPAGVSGSYYLWILAVDNVSNVAITRTNAFNLDNAKPVIILNGNNPTTINVGSTYTDAGATATDGHSGINGSITVTGSVNPATIGTYILTYNVSDKAGNAADAVTRTVNVINGIFNYAYTGNYQTFTAPAAGNYKIELWGAASESYRESDSTWNRSPGNYVSGNITLTQGQKLYIYAGGKGTEATSSSSNNGAGWNGGGSARMGDYGGYQIGRGGGGATDVRLVSGVWNDFNSLKSRIMVAGGAGTISPQNIWNTANSVTCTSNRYGSPKFDILGATQTRAGKAATGADTFYNQPGGFGYGGNGEEYYYGYGSIGGGGGYYGGSGGWSSDWFPYPTYAGERYCTGNATYGSSFVSGYTGCDAISSSSTVTNIIHTGQPNHYSGLVFTNVTTSLLTNTGDGSAKITFISQ
jgi:prepilin-type N-terminal cleavage/methylation domain-containing protein